jgi:pilus assembly protein CpaF
MDRTNKIHSRQILADTLSPLADFINDREIQEIMVNGPDNVWIERNGLLQKVDVALSEIQIRSAISVLAHLDGKEAKENSRDAIIDSRMEGLRVAAVLSPTSIHGHAICIRKHNPVHLGLDDYLAAGAFNRHRWTVAEEAQLAPPDPQRVHEGGEGLMAFLRWIVRMHKNVIVSGGTSSGKTTFLNALIAEVDTHERVLTIEDTPELKVRVPNFVSFESNEQAGVTTLSLVKLSLRFRPDRIIVGEVRGAEAFDLMQALNTGHDGGFCTLHANNAYAALARLENLILIAGTNWPHEAIRSQIAQTFDYVVHLARKAGRRAIQEVMEITGYEGGMYQFNHVFKQGEKS